MMMRQSFLSSCADGRHDRDGMNDVHVAGKVYICTRPTDACKQGFNICMHGKRASFMRLCSSINSAAPKQLSCHIDSCNLCWSIRRLSWRQVHVSLRQSSRCCKHYSHMLGHTGTMGTAAGSYAKPPRPQVRPKLYDTYAYAHVADLLSICICVLEPLVPPIVIRGPLRNQNIGPKSQRCTHHHQRTSSQHHLL